MPIKHIAKLNPEEMETWFAKHPCCPDEGALPIFEVVLWQLPNMTGIVRTYNFNFSMIETREQYKEMGLSIGELLNAIIQRMEELGIIRKMTDAEKHRGLH